MTTLRSPLVRLPATVVLLGLLCLSVLFIKNIVTSAWRQDQHEEARYLRAPNCFPHNDPSEVDASQPPCRDLTLTVVGKPQNTTVVRYRFQDRSRTYRYLTLRDGRGETRTVGDIYSDMWNSINVGDRVSAKIWQGHVQDVTANGYHCSIIDTSRWNRASGALWAWIILGLVCTCSLSLLWGFGGRSATQSFLFP